jgi:sterol 3beta-glucosyltransferase
VVVVVHHGGAHTTAAGLRAGVTPVIVPFFGDQFFWGWRVHELGAGPKWISRKKLAAVNLSAAVQQAVSDKEIGQRAAELGDKIRAEDGEGSAVILLERFTGIHS